MLRRAILAASRSDGIRRAVTATPLTAAVVDRFVAGVAPADAVRVTSSLRRDGLQVSLDHLGEDTTDLGQALATTKAYLVLLDALQDAGVAEGADLSVKLSAVGQLLDESMALDNARQICEAAAESGVTVTCDMEDHTTTDSTLGIIEVLRADFPWVGAVLQAYLHRTEQDCRDLAYAGSRVRLCKGAYKEPASVAYQSKRDVDASYVRCMKTLMEGAGYPMLATHDPRLVAIADDLAVRTGRGSDRFEFQMLFGIRPDEQRRLAAAGRTVRVYIPYGEEWYGYLVRRLAERPANLAFFLRSLVSRG